MNGRDDDEAIRELAVSVGLPTDEHVLRRYPHELSGGMAQRALIAKAIAVTEWFGVLVMLGTFLGLLSW